MSTAPQTTLSSVDTDQPCAGCGYSLRGLAVDTVCPECGTSVRRTLQGDLLEYSDPAYLRRLRIGAGMIFMSLLVFGALLVLSFLTTTLVRSSPVAITLSLLFLVVFVTFLFGWWQMTAPDHSRMPGGARSLSRRLVRIAAVLVLTSVTLLIVSEFMWSSRLSPISAAAGSALCLAGLPLWFYAGLTYVQRLAWRIPDMKIKRRAGAIIASSPLVLIFGVVATFIAVMDSRSSSVAGWIGMALFAAVYLAYLSLFLLLYAALRTLRPLPQY